MVSLYWYPSGGSFGSALIQDHLAYPSVPIVAILNPDSDVGPSYNPVFANATAQLQSAGITVIGYVWTDYGAAPLAQAESNISLYKSWYHVSGIFFDGMANTNSATDEQYYSTLTSYARSQGLQLTIGNPGASTVAGYVGTVNTINIYENSGMPSISALTQITGYGPSNFSYVSYAVPSLNTSAVNSTLPYVGYLFITNGTLPNPYQGAPPYFKALLADLAARG